MFLIPGNPEEDKKAEKKTPDDKVRLLSPCRDPVLAQHRSDTTYCLSSSHLTRWVPITLNLTSPPNTCTPQTHTQYILLVHGPRRKLECSVSEKCLCLGLLPLIVGPRSPETYHPLSSPAQAAWLPAVSLLCGSLSVQSPGEGRSGFPVRGLRIGVGCTGSGVGGAQIPMGKEKRNSGLESYGGQTWAQPRARYVSENLRGVSPSFPGLERRSQ